MSTFQKIILDFESKSEKLQTDQKAINNNFAKMDKSSKKATSTMNAGFKKSASSASSLKKSVVGLYAKILAGAMAFRKMYQATKDSIQSQALLTQVIKKTRAETGRSASDYKKWGKTLKSYTGDSNASINKLMALSATFTKISSNNMTQFMKTASDAATTWGMDTKQSIKMIGKVLQDPTVLSPLERLGVKFNEATEKQIKYLVSIGDSAKAQGLILNQLQNQFGGASEKLNNTMIGGIETAINQFTDAIAEIGKTILPPISKIISFIGTIAGAFSKLPTIVKGFGITLAGIIPIVLSLGSAFTFALGPVGLIVAAVAGLTGIISIFSSFTTSTADLVATNKRLASSYQDLKKEEAKFSKNDSLMLKLKNLKVGSIAYKKIVQEIIKLNPKLSRSNITLSSSYTDIEKSLTKLNTQQRLALLLKQKNLEMDALDAVKAKRFQLKRGEVAAKDGKKINDTRLKYLSAHLTALTTYYKIQYSKAKGNYLQQKFVMTSFLGNVNKYYYSISQMSKKTGGSFNSTIRDMKKEIKGLNDIEILSPKIKENNKGDNKNNFLGTTGQTKKQILAGNEWIRKLAIEEQTGLGKALLQLQYKQNDETLKADKKLAAMMKTGNLTEIEKQYDEMDKMDKVHQKQKSKLIDKYAEEHKTVEIKKNKESNAQQIKDTEQALNMANKLLQGDTEGFMQDMITQFGGQWGGVINAGISVAKTIFESFRSESESWADIFQKKLDAINVKFESETTGTSLMQRMGLLTGNEVNQQSVDIAEDALNSVLSAIDYNTGKRVLDFDEETIAKYLAGDFDKIISEGAHSLTGIAQSEALLGAEAVADIHAYAANAHQLTGQNESLIYLETLQSTAQNAISGIIGGIDDYYKYLEKYQTAKTEKTAFDIATLEHEIAMGREKDDDYYQQMDDAYTELLEVMNPENDGGATWGEMSAVQEAQYALQQEQLNAAEKTNDLLEEDGRSAELNSLFSLKKEIETQIAEGSLSNDTDTQRYLQSIMDNIILQQQREGIDTYAMREERANLVSGYYGNSFGGLSGAGTPVSISTTPMMFPQSNSITNNSNQYTTNIQSQSFADDIAVQVINSIEERYGIDILQGA